MSTLCKAMCQFPMIVDGEMSSMGECQSTTWIIIEINMDICVLLGTRQQYPIYAQTTSQIRGFSLICIKQGQLSTTQQTVKQFQLFVILITPQWIPPCQNMSLDYKGRKIINESCFNMKNVRKRPANTENDILIVILWYFDMNFRIGIQRTIVSFQI